MKEPVLILGQGLAGSLLAWELRKCGIPFAIHLGRSSEASSRVGAGIMNPVTGQRLVPSWRWAEHLPVSLETYRELEKALGCPLVRPFRIQRFYSSEKEREHFEKKASLGALGAHVTETFNDGFWIEGAWQVATALLVERMKRKLTEWGVVESDDTPVGERVVIACTGAAIPEAFAFARLAPAEGAILDFTAPELVPNVILNRGFWILPLPGGRARLGATFWAEGAASEERDRSLAVLKDNAEALLGRAIEVEATTFGRRVTTPDKHPVIGWSDGTHRLGIFNGLGSKGALHAPVLARSWAAHLSDGSAFLAECDVERLRDR